MAAGQDLPLALLLTLPCHVSVQDTVPFTPHLGASQSAPY